MSRCVFQNDEPFDERWRPGKRIGMNALRTRVAAVLMVCAVLVAPLREARAVPPSTHEQAQELHERAQTRYEMFDFVQAIDLWMEAYRLLKADESTREIRNAIVWNIATARIKAYEVDKDVRHLHQGLLLLRKYLQEYVALYGTEPEAAAEKAKIETKLQELSSLINAAQPDEPVPSAPFPEKTPPTVASTPATTPPPVTDRQSPQRKGKLGPLTIAGISSIVVGLGFAGLMTAGLVRATQVHQDFEDKPDERGELEVKGNQANTMGVAGMIGAGVFIATGVTLIIVDRVKRKKGSHTALVPVPTIGPGFAGASWSARF